MAVSLDRRRAQLVGRRRYQAEVEALLELIRTQVAELHRLKARGVRGRALAERKRELARARTRLAAVVGAGAA